MSIWWFSCRILGYCGNAYSEVRLPELIVELQQGSPLLYTLSRGDDGALNLQPDGHGREANAILDAYLDSLPDIGIRIISMDTGIAGEILELLQRDGADTARIHTIIDKERGPVRIMPHPDTAVSGTGARFDEEPVNATGEETSAESAANTEAQAPDETPLPPSKVPCPQLYTRVSPPGMAPLLYPENSARVRCTINLRIFADAAAVTLSADSALQLVLTGHADASESGGDTEDLAMGRAESIRSFLAGRGLPADRILAVSAGADLPAGDVETPEGRMMNRRLEISWDRINE